MTDRINGFVVVLEKDIREDDFEVIKNAVMMIRGVSTIIPNIVTPSEHIARKQAVMEFRNGLYDYLEKLDEKKG